MKYQETTFTIPVSHQQLSEDEYDLRVGKITQQEYNRRVEEKASK